MALYKFCIIIIIIIIKKTLTAANKMHKRNIARHVKHKTFYSNRKQTEQSINQSNYFIVRLKVDQRAGQLSLPHIGITKTERYN